MSETTVMDKPKALELNGLSRKKSKEESLAYFYDLQTQMCDAISTEINCVERLATINQKLKASPVGIEKKKLEKAIRETRQLIADIKKMRDGALGLLKKQGVDLSTALAKMQMLPSDD